MTAGGQSILTVSQLTEYIKRKLETDKLLSRVMVSGEISNFKRHTSGHLYFTLKDETSRLRTIMFSSRARSLPFVPEDGMRVICTGSLGVFERDGQYQLYVDEMQPDGVGALYVAFAQLRDRLANEGLFADVRKRALPRFPRRIGVVTSPTGAVIRDICSTLTRRYPLAKVILAPALVQGPGAAATIVAGIEKLLGLGANGKQPVDVIIVARGGGSLEELWPFNEEVVARAIAASSIPVVSAVGHETDFTIADFVADVRAATPTAAAELVAPHVQELNSLVLQFRSRSENALKWKMSESLKRLQTAENSPVLRAPLRLIDRPRQHVDFLEGQLRQNALKPIRVATRKVADLSERIHRVNIRGKVSASHSLIERLHNRLSMAVRRQTAEYNGRLERHIGTLEALNPLGVLRRGYSVVYKQDGSSVVMSTQQVRHGESIRVRVTDGEINALVQLGEERGVNVGEQVRLDI